MPNLETLQNCIDFLWPGSGIKRTKNQINEFISLFNSTYSRIASESIRHSMDAANTLFTRAMQACLKEPHLRRSASGNKAFMDNLKVSVETYVMDGISKRVFKGVSSFLADQDAMFNKTTRNLTDLQLKDLQVNPIICKNIPKCKKIISNLNKFTTPLEKLYVLKLTIMAMSETSKSKPDEDYAITSDDLLPALVFLVVKSEIPNWLANLSYMQNFHFSKAKNDELQFYLSSTEAAIEHVRSGRLDSMISMTHTQRVKMIDTLLQGLDSSEKYSGPSPVDIFFEKIRTKDVEDVLKSLNDSESNLEKLTESLCHPLCGCDKCKKLQASKQNEPSTVTVFSRDDIGCTALHQAAECGCEEIIYELIKKGAVVNAMNYHGTTPLHYACQRGHLKALVLLAHYKADINAADNSGNTPLHLAAANGHELCMEFLLSSDCEIRSDRKIEIDAVNEHGDTALHIASRWGFGRIVFLVLRHNAATGIKNKAGKTPFQCALNEKIQEIFSQETNEFKDGFDSNSSYLSPSGAETIKAGYILPDSPATTRRKKEFTKLLKAIADGNTELVRQKLGISKEPDSISENPYPDVEYIDELLCHPLCQCEKCAVLQKKVVSEAVTINANTCNSEGVRPLHVASIHGYEDIVTILLRESAADPNVKTKENHRTPLHLACQYNNIECVSLLIKYGARVNLKDINGNTALHFCCTNGHIGPAILLLQGGANLHASNQRGNTPLHDAVRWDYYDLAKLLLYYKAPLDPVNKMHLTPLQYARGNEVRVLLERATLEAEDAKESGDATPKTKGVTLFGDDMTVDELFSYEKSKERTKSQTSFGSNIDKREKLYSDELFPEDLKRVIENANERECEVVDNLDKNMKAITDLDSDVCTCSDVNIQSGDKDSSHTLNTYQVGVRKQGSSYETKSCYIPETCDSVNVSAVADDFHDDEHNCANINVTMRPEYEIKKYIDISARRTTVAEIFAAMESDELDRLRMIAEGINKFDRRKSLKSVTTIDKSSAFLNRQFSQQIDDVFEEALDVSIPPIVEEPYDVLLKNYASGNNDDNNNNSSPTDDVESHNNSTISAVIGGLTVEATKQNGKSAEDVTEVVNVSGSKSTDLRTDSVPLLTLSDPVIQNEPSDPMIDEILNPPIDLTANINDIIISGHADSGDITISSNDLITSRISELINEAIDDNDSDIICTTPTST